MKKSFVFGAVALAVASGAGAASCIITGDTERSCSASGSSGLAVVDVRSGTLADGSKALSESAPLECRQWAALLSNTIPLLDCTRPLFTLIFLR